MLPHPYRSLLLHSGINIKRRANSDKNRHAKPITVGVHPFFLFGRAQTYPENIRRRGINHLYNFLIFFRCQQAKRRRVCADRIQPGVSTLKSLCQLLRNPRRSAKEEMPCTRRSRALANSQHQLWPISPTWKPKPAKSSQPYQRHPIRNDQIGRIQDRFKRRIVLRFHNTVHSSNGDETAEIAMLDPCFYLLDDPENLRCV